MAAIAQAGQILNALSGEERFVSFVELVHRTGLPKSSVHTVLAQLVELRLVERGPGATYRIGLRIVELASSRLNNMDVVQRFVEVCASWQRLPDEAIVLSVLEGDDVLYLACRNGSRPVGVQYRIGMRLPATSTASGKAILAWRSGPEPHPDPRLEVELKQTRARGYSIDDEETVPGMLCFGAPVEPLNKDPVWCAVAISFVKALIPPSEYTHYGEEVMALARALS